MRTKTLYIHQNTAVYNTCSLLSEPNCVKLCSLALPDGTAYPRCTFKIQVAVMSQDATRARAAGIRCVFDIGLMFVPGRDGITDGCEPACGC